ncbi:UNVERIFIED_CONTAM: hypothetical protein HHA_454230 [Hammondia hammondi]|eukprot:XP_008887639.1 hypothetical protein HHA_454230 [Hammondia hammondi]
MSNVVYVFILHIWLYGRSGQFPTTLPVEAGCRTQSIPSVKFSPSHGRQLTGALRHCGSLSPNFDCSDISCKPRHRAIPLVFRFVCRRRIRYLPTQQRSPYLAATVAHALRRHVARAAPLHPQIKYVNSPNDPPSGSSNEGEAGAFFSGISGSYSSSSSSLASSMSDNTSPLEYRTIGSAGGGISGCSSSSSDNAASSGNPDVSSAAGGVTGWGTAMAFSSSEACTSSC